MRRAVLAVALSASLGSGAASAQPDRADAVAPRTGWPMLPIPDMPASVGGARADIDRIISDFERVCLDSKFDRRRIGGDEAFTYVPGAVANPRGDRISVHVWRASNRAVQLANVDDQGMGNQCTFTVTTRNPVDIQLVHARMTNRFGQQRNYRDDQAAFRAADGRFSPDWIAYRAHWLGAGDGGRPRIVLFAQSFDGGTGALARNNGVHLTAAELTE